MAPHSKRNDSNLKNRLSYYAVNQAEAKLPEATTMNSCQSKFVFPNQRRDFIVFQCYTHRCIASLSSLILVGSFHSLPLLNLD